LLITGRVGTEIVNFIMGKRGPSSAAKKTAKIVKSWRGKTPPWESKGLSRAERVIKFCEVLPISSGTHAGRRLKLRPWQKEIIEAIYKTDRGKRKVRTALLTLPRKNGKSQLASSLALCHLLGPESEPRGQVYSAAADREQAAIIFKEMEAMILRIPEFEKRCHIQSFHKRITDYETGSEYHAMSSDCRKALGLSPSFIVYDELAQAKDRELFDNLVTGTGARAEPLTVVISTQSPDPNHIMTELVDYGLAIDKGTLSPDPTFYYGIYVAPEEADPWDESVWHACNPALGDFRSLEEMRNFAEQARKIPTKENVFRNLYLNQRVDSAARWISSVDFDQCVGDIPDLTGRECYAGLDLSSTQDLSALSLCFAPISEEEPFYILPFAWCPSEAVAERCKRVGVPYDVWTRHGYIESTPGAVVDYGFILARIDELARQYDLKAVLFDRWGATKIIQELSSRGMTVIEFGQGFASMSPPTKELEKLIIEKKIRFPENPALRWCFSNVICESDAAGNLKPSKKRSKEKIDMVVSSIMALDGAVRNMQKDIIPKIAWM
jgi:phage terminase large subunit-like protein